MSDEKERGMEVSRPGREKYWSELAIEEKIERMRIQIKSLQSQVGHLDRKIDQLLEHSHSGGKIVIPLARHDVYGGKEEVRMRSGEGKEDVYF